jgi:hypothetical protein
VNNPYRYLEVDKFGRSLYDSSSDQVGVVKGNEYGGSNHVDAGCFHALMYEDTVASNNFELHQRTARVYQETQSKM